MDFNNFDRFRKEHRSLVKFELWAWRENMLHQDICFKPFLRNI